MMLRRGYRNYNCQLLNSLYLGRWNEFSAKSCVAIKRIYYLYNIYFRFVHVNVTRKEDCFYLQHIPSNIKLWDINCLNGILIRRDDYSLRSQSQFFRHGAKVERLSMPRIYRLQRKGTRVNNEFSIVLRNGWILFNRHVDARIESGGLGTTYQAIEIYEKKRKFFSRKRNIIEDIYVFVSNILCICFFMFHKIQIEKMKNHYLTSMII